MTKRLFQLTEHQVRQLQQREQQTRDVYEVKRLQAVRLYGTGTTTASICATLMCAGRSIRQWAQRYQQHGLSGLQSHWQGNNALKLNRQQRQELKERLHQYLPDQVLSDEVRISRGVFWTVSDLRLVIEQWYQVSYQSEATYLNLLHECGFSYQRAERVYRSRSTEQQIADFEAKLEKK
jgi:transposase